MEVCYDKLWNLLYDRRIYRSDIAVKIGVSRNTLSKMKRNEPVSLVVLLKFCEELNVEMNDIVDFVKTQKE